jgi:aspartyl protease family protein
MVSLRQSKFWIWWFVGAIGLGVLIVWLASLFPETLESDEARMGLLHSVLVLALVSSGLAAHRKLRPGHVLRNAAIWLAVASVLFIGYSYRHDLSTVKDRVVGEFLPHQGEVVGAEVRFRASENCHFVIQAKVNGTPIRFLVDTGASDVTLSPGDARRMGIDINSLSFNRRYATANGTVFGAPIRLNEISIGPISIRNVRASVNGADMGRSLLGMSFLEHLDGFSISKDILTLNAKKH